MTMVKRRVKVLPIDECFSVAIDVDARLLWPEKAVSCRPEVRASFMPTAKPEVLLAEQLRVV